MILLLNQLNRIKWVFPVSLEIVIFGIGLSFLYRNQGYLLRVFYIAFIGDGQNTIPYFLSPSYF